MNMNNTAQLATELSRNMHRVAPRTSVEESLLAIWSQTLNLNAETIGIEDSYLDIGGANSLLIIQLIARILEHFNVEIPLAEVLAHPTISQLAAIIEAANGCKP